MIKYLLFYSVLFTTSCSGPGEKLKENNNDSIVNSTSAVRRENDTLQTPSDNNGKSKTIITRKDTLTPIESKFLSLITKENEFILISKEVERTFSLDGKLLVSKMLFSKQELEKGGYISTELSFYGNLTDRVNILYSYSMGQASYGYGCVTGDDINSYLHTIKSCGVTSCIIQVVDTGKKIFEKENKN